MRGTGKVIPLRKTWIWVIAQLKLEFKYLENVVTPAELPAIISATRPNSLDGIKGGLQ
jgi:hypothetical protein